MKFLKNKGNPDAFEPAPSLESAPAVLEQAPAPATGKTERYSVQVEGKVYDVLVAPNGELKDVVASSKQTVAAAPAAVASDAEDLTAPLSGNIFKVQVKAGHQVKEGEVVIILEAMKMETEIRSTKAGTVGEVYISEGDAVSVGDALLSIA